MVFFGYYLVERGLVTDAEVLNALDQQHAAKTPIGQLAKKTGRLTEDQVYAVLNEQERQRVEGRKKPFGQIAQEMGLLKEHDIVALLEEQIFRRKPIGEILVEMGAIEQATMERELQTFMNYAGHG